MMRKVKSQEVESKPPHFKPATKKNDKYFPENAHGKLFAKILQLKGQILKNIVKEKRGLNIKLMINVTQCQPKHARKKPQHQNLN